MKHFALIGLLPLFSLANTLVVTNPSGEFVKAIPLENGFHYQVMSDTKASQLQQQHRLQQLESTLQSELSSHDLKPIDTSPFPLATSGGSGQTTEVPMTIPSAVAGTKASTVITEEPMVAPKNIVQTEESRRLHDEYRRLIERQMSQPPRDYCIVALQLSSIGRVQSAKITEGAPQSCQAIITAIHRVPHFPMPLDPISLPAARFSSIAFSPKRSW